MLEILRRNPHLNIVVYHGAIVARGRIVGLNFDRLSETLEDRLKDPRRRIDANSCMNDIIAAVKRLHSLGLAHNDVKPGNIMLDANDTAVLIDFGSCQPFGNALITAGSRDWIDEEYFTSAQKHDEIAIGKIRTWLRSRDVGLHDNVCTSHAHEVQPAT